MEERLAEVLGLGLTHYSLLLRQDATMAALLKSTLKDPDIPAELKDPANWSQQAQDEWDDDELQRWEERRMIDRETWVAAGKHGVIGLSAPE